MAARIAASDAPGLVKSQLLGGRAANSQDVARLGPHRRQQAVANWPTVQPALRYSTTFGLAPASVSAARTLREVPQAGLWKMVTSAKS